MKKRIDGGLLELGVFEIFGGLWAVVLGGVAMPIAVGCGTVVALHGLLTTARAVGWTER